MRIAYGLLTCLLLSLPALAKTGIEPAEIIVKFRDTPAASQKIAAMQAVGGYGVMRHIGRNTHVLQLPDAAAPRGAKAGVAQRMAAHLAALRADPTVEYAEPNYLGEFADLPPPVATPNDPGFAGAWWLATVGAQQAWAVSSGNGVKIAVVDTGADLAHPDLQANLLPGYNFGDSNAKPQDQLGHGTRVTGIVAGIRGNALGASGLAPLAKIVPVKINVGGSGTFDSATLAQSIDYATPQGAKVINLSLTVDQDTQTVTLAIQRAQAAGIIVVAATGNDGGPVEFPATLPNVIAVAATNQDGTLASYSSTGAGVTLAAPGTGIFTTLLGGATGIGGSGTSYSAPMVTATVANMLAVEPRLSPQRLIAQLQATTRPVQGSLQTYGILDAGSCLLSLLPNLTVVKNAGNMSVAFNLPVTGGPDSIYVGIGTPFGDFTLQADTGFSPVTASGYRPIAVGYDNAAVLSGLLFGTGGVFPAIALAGLPAGSYVWRIALVNAATGAVIGPVVESPVQLP